MNAKVLIKDLVVNRDHTEGTIIRLESTRVGFAPEKALAANEGQIAKPMRQTE